MPNFTARQQEELRVILGYASTPHLLTTELSESRQQAVIDQAIALMAELSDPSTGVDAQLKAARSDSMATAVGQLHLSYSQHVTHLKSEGSRLLKELSFVLGVKLVYNKYAIGQSKSTRSYW